jgi:D-alanyl-D-alanine carboxypeptidase
MRMPWLFARLLVLSLALPAACSSPKGGAPDSGDSGDSADDADALDLDGVLARVVADNDGHGGGILQATAPSGTRYRGATGDATVGGPPITTDDTFEVASITKTFTATTVLLLVEDGAFSLDDPLSSALPDWSTGLLVVDGVDHTPGITVRQLLNHTSGLPDYWADPPYVQGGVNAFLEAFIADPDRSWTPQEILAYVPDLEPIGTPGSTWHYSDTNYVLLGLIIERATGEPLRDAFRDRLFDPLALDDTWTSFREGRPLPEAHRYEGDWDMSDKTHQTADWAGGGLISTADDLTVFLRALAEGEIFREAGTLAAMQAGVPTGYDDVSYGLGLFQVALDDGTSLWGHEGYGNSFMYLHTRDDTIYAGALNQTENDWWPLIIPSL